MTSLDLALIGNGTIGALIDPQGEIVWACFPALRRRSRRSAPCCGGAAAPRISGSSRWTCVDCVRSEQEYLVNTPVLVTRLYDRNGGGIEITDFCAALPPVRPDVLPDDAGPRRSSGSPALRGMRCGCARPTTTAAAGRASPAGSNHIRYVGSDLVLRLTTDASVTAMLEENAVLSGRHRHPAARAGRDRARRRRRRRAALLRGDRALLARVGRARSRIPFEWQDAVIRAAITLKLNVFEDTGAIIAAMTTSIPEAPGSGRNWDYRYCWLRDAYFVVNALNRLGRDALDGALPGLHPQHRRRRHEMRARRLQPVYTVSGRSVTPERDGGLAAGISRHGAGASRQPGIRAGAARRVRLGHSGRDPRVLRPAAGATREIEALFRRLEPLGEHAAAVFDQPDAGIWELRGTARVHTFSSVMCWAGCDRLARIATHLGLADRAGLLARPGHAHPRGDLRGAPGTPAQGSFVATMDGDALDASLLRLNELGFLADGRSAVRRHGARDRARAAPGRFRLSLSGTGRLRHAGQRVSGLHLLVHQRAGGHRPSGTRRGRCSRSVLACRNRHGLLAEHIDPRDRRAVGQLRPDLQHGRAHRLGDPPVGSLGSGVLTISTSRGELTEKLART